MNRSLTVLAEKIIAGEPVYKVIVSEDAELSVSYNDFIDFLLDQLNIVNLIDVEFVEVAHDIENSTRTYMVWGNDMTCIAIDAQDLFEKWDTVEEIVLETPVSHYEFIDLIKSEIDLINFVFKKNFFPSNLIYVESLNEFGEGFDVRFVEVIDKHVITVRISGRFHANHFAIVYDKENNPQWADAPFSVTASGIETTVCKTYQEARRKLREIALYDSTKSVTILDSNQEVIYVRD